jgi:hypothetical protein
MVQVMQVASKATLNLTRVTIADGFTDANGGGIENEGKLTVTDSAFSGNTGGDPFSGVGDGGGIDNVGVLTIANSSFSGNLASADGGGINNVGMLTIANSSFSRNFASPPGSFVLLGEGGGVWNGGTMTITNSSFSGNSTNLEAGGGGAGAIGNQGVSTIANSSFVRNAGHYAGAIFNVGGTMALVNDTFSDNVADDTGAVYNHSANMTVTNSTFYLNSCSFDGAAITNRNGKATIINSTFSNDTSDQSAIFNDTGVLSVTASTFSANDSLGIGIINFSGSATLKSAILAGSPCYRVSDGGYNISDDSSCAFTATGSLNNTDPKLDPAGLANNGGPTQTIALQSDSPAIDAIPVAHCTDQASPANPIITDQRLFPRPDVGEVNCNIGAYEVQDKSFLPFSSFGGSLKIDPDAGVFYLSGGFKLGSGGSIDPVTQPVAFGVGSYAIRLPIGSFVKYSSGYVYQKKVGGIFLCVFIKFTNTPGTYQLLANRIGGTLDSTTSPLLVTLTVGDNSGNTGMNAKFY